MRVEKKYVFEKISGEKVQSLVSDTLALVTHEYLEGRRNGALAVDGAEGMLTLDIMKYLADVCCGYISQEGVPGCRAEHSVRCGDPVSDGGGVFHLECEVVDSPFGRTLHIKVCDRRNTVLFVCTYYLDESYDWMEL